MSDEFSLSSEEGVILKKMFEDNCYASVPYMMRKLKISFEKAEWLSNNVYTESKITELCSKCV